MPIAKGSPSFKQLKKKGVYRTDESPNALEAGLMVTFFLCIISASLLLLWHNI